LIHFYKRGKQNKITKMAMSDWISLDVGGRKLSTTRSTLVSNPNSALARMFDPNSGLQPARMVDGSYTIDADPDCFQVLLNWLRYKKVMFPTSHQNYESVSAVAEVYGILDLVGYIKSLQNDDRKVVLDVGGVKMCTLRETFDKLRGEMDKSGSKDKIIVKQVDGSYFIDADPTEFKAALDLYRDDAALKYRELSSNSFKYNNYHHVYGMIKHSVEEDGIAKDTIFNQVQGKMSQVEVENTLEYLSNEGHIYTTINDDHFKETVLKYSIYSDSFEYNNCHHVYGMIKHSVEEDGLSKDAIFNQVQEKMSQVEVENILEYLSSEGHIYSTINEDHFKPTE